MKNDTMEILATMWNLLWRSTLLMPIFIVFMAIMIGAGLAQFVLPFFAGLCAWFGLWVEAGLYTGFWILSVLLWRIDRLRSLMESPPSLL